MKQYILLSVLLAAGTLAWAQSDAPAFPGAEGFARYTTTGGRGGAVIHVTNLNDSGTGSLRWALSQTGPKTIVFDVSGYIDLKSDLKITSNTTIAGQTAPGEGITLRYYTITFTDCDNVICRFIRFRRSQVKSVNDSADATWGRRHQNIILDHCSFSWSIDEIASFYDNRNFTMQWCTLGEGLNEPGHSKGAHSYGGIWGGKGASFHHNFIAHVQNRSPRFCGARYNWDGYDHDEYENSLQAERVDFRNCVMYNWGSGSGCYGGTGGGYINMINNYYKAGPGTSKKTRVTEITVASKDNSSDNSTYWGYSSRYFILGNYVTAAPNGQQEDYDWKGVVVSGTLYTIDGEYYMPDAKHYYGEEQVYVPYQTGNGTEDCVRVKLDNAIPAGEVTTHMAEDAYEKVLAYAGASLHRDAVDARYMEEAATGTTTYRGEIAKRDGIIDMVNDPELDPDDIANYASHANYPDLKEETRPAGYDTDGDGMPDEWEEANGLNKNNADDAKLYTLDTQMGWYTNLEVYMNGLVERIQKDQNADAVEEVDEYYPKQTFVNALDKVGVESCVSRVEYYTLDGIRLSEPAEGICVRRIVYVDGTANVQKVIR